MPASASRPDAPPPGAGSAEHPSRTSTDPRRHPTLAAAICTRDRPQQLRRALASLFAQRSTPAEVLVIDNSRGDDRTRDLVLREFPAARYHREPRPGLNCARNFAIRVAGTDVVAFLDDDAIADPAWADRFLEVFDRHPAVAACTGRVEALVLETEAQRLFEANGGFSRGEEQIRLPADAVRPLHGRRAPLIAWAVSVGCGCSFAVRRSTVLSIGGFDDAFGVRRVLGGGDDLDLLWRLLAAGHEIVYEPAVLAWHEHRREMTAVYDQLAGHQRGLVAFLCKAAASARGSDRLPVLAFLIWRLLKPGVRLGRRIVGRDPLPAPALAKMWWNCWRGLVAYRPVPAIADGSTGPGLPEEQRHPHGRTSRNPGE